MPRLGEWTFDLIWRNITEVFSVGSVWMSLSMETGGLPELKWEMVGI